MRIDLEIAYCYIYAGVRKSTQTIRNKVPFHVIDFLNNTITLDFIYLLNMTCYLFIPKYTLKNDNLKFWYRTK